MPKFAIAFAVALSFSTGALAQSEAVNLEGDVKLERVETANGSTKTVLVEPSVVVPGDRLIFSTRYTNSSSQTVENFVVTNPLPGAVALAPEMNGNLAVSVDGGKLFGLLSTLTVPDGKGGVRQALASDVTHIRWVLTKLAPGASGTLTYQAIVR